MTTVERVSTTFAETATIGTRAVPLGKTTPGSGAEDLNAHGRRAATNWHRLVLTLNMRRNTKATAPKNGRYMDVLEGLKLGVGVRADFAVQVDLFVLRGNPFHEQCSLSEVSYAKENSTIPIWENRENPLGRGRWSPNGEGQTQDSRDIRVGTMMLGIDFLTH